MDKYAALRLETMRAHAISYLTVLAGQVDNPIKMINILEREMLACIDRQKGNENEKAILKQDCKQLHDLAKYDVMKGAQRKGPQMQSKPKGGSNVVKLTFTF